MLTCDWLIVCACAFSVRSAYIRPGFCINIIWPIRRMTFNPPTLADPHPGEDLYWHQETLLCWIISPLTPPETVCSLRVDGNRRVAESSSIIQLARERLRSFDETSGVNRASRPVTGSGRWQWGGRYINTYIDMFFLKSGRHLSADSYVVVHSKIDSKRISGITSGWVMVTNALPRSCTIAWVRNMLTVRDFGLV